MPLRKPGERIEQARRELESRSRGDGVSLADVGRDLAEIKLTLGYQDVAIARQEEASERLHEILMGDGKKLPGVVADVHSVKSTVANYTRVVWMLVAIVIGTAATAFVGAKSTEKPRHPEPREEQVDSQFIQQPRFIQP